MDEITTPLPPVPLEVIEDKPGVTSSGNPLGRAVHSKAVEDYELLTPKEQHEALRTTWRAVAYGIASRARTYAANCSAKDFGKLYQLVQAGATSLDKAFPPREQAQSTKLVFNLFNSLGQRAARIAIPQTPGDMECESTSGAGSSSASTSTPGPSSSKVIDVEPLTTSK